MKSFSQTLQLWYATEKRNLPWRNVSDPYLIWVSEIILQQTRVSQGLEYYLRFIQRFPSVEALAAATDDEVMRAWQGLGYYSRARNLHEAARNVVDLGTFPRDYAGVRSLKGVGDYTAAAICSFAYGTPVATVDGNVYRVLSRYFGMKTPIDTANGRKEFASLAQEVLDPNHPSIHNQAMMDFGATWCTPRAPKCDSCPFVASCIAAAEQQQESYPVKLKRLKQETRYLTYFIFQRNDCIFLHRRPQGGIWAELYEPLLIDCGRPMGNAEQLETLNSYIPSNEEMSIRLVASGVKHILTHRKLIADCYLVSLSPECCPQLPQDFICIPLEEIERYPLPRLVQILLERTHKQ